MKFQKNFILWTLAAFVLLVIGILFFSWSSNSYADDYDEITKTQSEEFVWPLSPLTQKERYERIVKFIKPYKYKLYAGVALSNNYRKSEKKRCYDILKNIQEISKDNILEPVYIAQSSNDTWIKDNLLQVCGETLEPTKIYYPNKDVWLNNSNPQNMHSYYFEVQKNLEFYNFSDYLKDGVWGLWGEFARPQCKDYKSDICSNESLFQTQYNIFDISSCDSLSKAAILSVRYTPKFYGKSKVEYERIENFHAFLVINSNVYQLNFRTKLQDDQKDCSTEHCAIIEDQTDLFIEEIDGKKMSSQKQCIFNIKI